MWRFLAAVQLLPALENGEETTLVGGQAVLEGVMMRSPHAWAIAVRKPSGEVVSHSEPLERLSEKAWAGDTETFYSRPSELAQVFLEEERLVLLAEREGRPLGYLSAIQLGRTLGIEELAVLPDLRRRGIGRALLSAALSKTTAAALTVGEDNRPARALYRSFGFRQAGRRLLFERRPGSS